MGANSINFCCCVGSVLDVIAKHLICHTWVAAATIGAQSTVVEQQLVESKSIDVLSEPMINGESTVSSGGAQEATTRAG